jgi:hypothetical protein
LPSAAHQLTDRLSKVIFYSALVPARGVPLAEENPAYSRMIRDDIAATPDGTITITREHATLLVPGAPKSTCDLLLEPTPGHYYTDALDLPDLTTLNIGLAYLLSEEDHVLARPGIEFAARARPERHDPPWRPRRHAQPSRRLRQGGPERVGGRVLQQGGRNTSVLLRAGTPSMAFFFAHLA